MSIWVAVQAIHRKHSGLLAFGPVFKLLYDVFPKEHTDQRFTDRWNDYGMYIQHAIVLNSHFLGEGEYLTQSKFAKFAKSMARNSCRQLASNTICSL
jgi:hypothetical protein